MKPLPLCLSVLAASASLQQTASARDIPDNYSCYNTNAVAIDDWSTVDINALSQATRKVGGQSLRLSGGDTANYWDWDSGGVIEWYNQDSSGNVQVRQPLQFPYFFPEELPVSLNFQYGTKATLANVKSLVSGADAEPIWVMNMISSTLDKELRHLQEAAALGMPVTRVELGNELYFGLPNYTRPGFNDSEPLQRGVTTPADYASKAKDWAIAVKDAFPNANIAVTGVSPSATSEQRIKDWLPALKTKTGPDNRSALDVVDAFTLHPYYTTDSLGVTKADVGNRARAGEIARDGISAQRGLLRNPELRAPELLDKQLWITEHNVIEDATVVLGNSWVHALMMDVQTQDFLQDERTEVSCAHVLTGNPQWQAIATEDGSAIDPILRGISDRPFGQVARPFETTATGVVLGKTAEIFDNGKAELILSKEAAIGWLVNDGKLTISIVNANDQSESYFLPAGEIWKVITYTADPWATIMAETDLDISLDELAGGSLLDIPAFSKIIAQAKANAGQPQPPDSQSVPEPATGIGIGLAAAAMVLSRRKQGREKAEFSS